MIYAFIRATLGPAGSAVLDFYIANSIWINGLLLLYALLVALARHTFDVCEKRLVAALREQYGTDVPGKRPAPLLRTLKTGNLPWEAVLRSSSFPFIAPPGSIRLYMKNAAVLQRFLPLEKLIELLKQA